MTPTHPLLRRASRLVLRGSIAALALGAVSAHAAGEITREEYLEMKRELASLRQEVKALRTAKPAPAASPGETASRTSNASINQSITDLGNAVDAVRSGETKFLLTGSAEGTFTSARNSASNFSAVFEPLFLWHINESLLFQGEVELELEGSHTNTKLEFAEIDWSLNDNLTLVGGKFLNPVNTYVERYAPTWIRKLPDNPLGLYDGFLPESNVGFELRGVYPIGSAHVNFALYVSNAPRLITDDPEALGSLDFDNWESQADAKAYGGRVGVELFHNVEVGYGAQYARVRDNGTPSTSNLLQSVDLSGNLNALKGRFMLLSQYAWSKTGDFTYDSYDDNGDYVPLKFSNKRSGGYVQASYRAKQWESDFFNRLEFVVRGDVSKAPHDAPGGFDERRLTFGVDYWIASATVLKAAYEIDHRDNGEPNGDAFLLQLSTGF